MYVLFSIVDFLILKVGIQKPKRNFSFVGKFQKPNTKLNISRFLKDALILLEPLKT